MVNNTIVKLFKTPNFKLLTHLLINCHKPNSSQSEIIAIPVEDRGDYCPRSFDGFACWYGPPGTETAFENCPEYIVGFDPRRYPFKQCIDDGSWLKDQTDATLPRTSMTACIDTDDFSFLGLNNSIYMSGYSTSIVALMISILIMTKFQSLHCIRNRIHTHLFSSYIFSNLCWILTYGTVVNDVSIMLENTMWCQILHVVTHYFMLTGYAWMFCEGLHLFLSLAVVFIEEEFSMRLFKFIGWIMPAFIVTAYAIRRHYTPNGTERCWIEDSDATWIISIPVLGSLLASVGFLIYIVRVLVKKMDPNPNESNFQTIMKAARATLMLIPLFGLHFLLVPIQPSGETTLKRSYHVFSSFLISFQGFYISVLFCFTNQEVITAVRNYFWRTRNARDAGRATGITGADSMQHTQQNAI